MRQALSWRVASEDLLPNHMTIDDVLRRQTAHGFPSASEEERRSAEHEN
jgi:hypothetical protein